MKQVKIILAACLMAMCAFAQQSVTSLTLMNSDTDLPMVGYDPLVDGSSLDLGTLPTRNMNIRANTSPETVGSVRFAYNGNANQQTETSAPYALMRDTSGDYWDWTPAVGSHTVTATPYSGASATGTIGTPLTINFTVTDSGSTGGGEEPGGGTVTGTGAWIEKDGILVVDAEHVDLDSSWVARPTTHTTDATMAGSLGDGWLEWTGAQYSGNTKTESQVNAIISFTFKIETAGDYFFRWRSKQYSSVAAGDAGNDTFVSLTSGTAVSGYQDFGQFHKVWVQSKDAWSWRTTFEPVHASHFSDGNVRRHYEAGTHTIRFAARSPGHAIDRFVLHKTSIPFNAATFEAAAESDREGAPETKTYTATTDFANINSGEVPYYVDNGRNALAINAGNASYRGKFARAQTTFSGVGSTYDVSITSMKELDGECTYRFLVDGVVVGTAQNDETTTDYALQTHVFAGITIASNATIAVESNTDSNGKVPEDDAYAWARGRWTTLTLTPASGGGGGVVVDADPVANAGADVALILPNTQITLNGSATDDGTVDSLAWSQVSGPNTALLSDTNAATLTTSGLVQGSYVFRLTATDDAGNSASDDMIVTVTTANSAGVAITGELRQWHKVTLTLDGPTATEGGTPNPFTDYRMNITFTHPTSGLSYVVPGYFAADGNAAESGATSGNKWRAHLSPDHIGEWNYVISFRSGSNVAMGGAGAGAILAPYNAKSGSFTVAASDKSADDFRTKGRLVYDGTRYLKFASAGTAFIKTGADAPENFLAYNEFDNTYTHGQDRIKSWGPHVVDWQSGDPTWKGGKGKGIIGAINYLASEGQNVFSFLTYNAGGDSKDIWPFTQHTNPLVYDCSKLDQWEIVFQHGQNKGMYLHFKTQETENDNNNQWALDNGEVGNERKLYYRELIARFGHHLALNWNLGEENNQSQAQEIAMAQYFADNDPYHHNIVLHTYPGEHYRYDWHLGNKSELTGVSLQTAHGNVHKHTLTQINNSTAAGQPWVVANDEQGSANLANPPDAGWPGYAGGTSPSQRNMRANVVWGNLMAGGAGVELYAGYQMPESDLTLQDFRSRDRMWDYCRHAKFFFNNHLPFSQMKSADGLVGNSGNNNTKYCLAKDDQVYAIYLVSGGTTSLNLAGATGQFIVKWFDPRNGGGLLDGSVTTVNGGGSVSIGNPPNNTTLDWAVLVCRAGDENNGENLRDTPVVSAGADQSIVLPDNQLSLTGSASDNGSIASLEWTQDSGPNDATLSGEATAVLQISDLVAGTYVFRLTATDDEDKSESDTVTVIVKENTVPSITTTTVPDATATLVYNESLALANGDAPFTWSLVSGSLPGGLSLNAAGKISGTPTVESTNTFTVSVKDKDNESDEQVLTLIVGPEPNTALLSFNPTDDAYIEGTNPLNNTQLKIEGGRRVGYLKFDVSGISETIESAVLSMKVAGDAGNGTINFYVGSHNSWTESTLTSAGAPAKGAKIGTMTGAFANGSVYTVDLKSMLQGTGDGVYTVIIEMVSGGNDAWFSSKEGAFAPKLEVVYDKGVIIGQAPEVDAGQDITVTLPENEATLGGSASDAEGAVTIVWTKVSGPSAVMTGSATETLTVSELTQGVYVFEIKATDSDGNSRKDSAVVTVKAEPLPPVDLGAFNTGSDIFLPQFDSNRDPDDLHSLAAVGCILAHEDYAGVNVFAVHGAFGDQADSNFIASPELFTVVFGAENDTWVNAYPQDSNWNGAVAKIVAKVKPILLAGGKAWVAEAGQSDITADWVRALIADGIPAATIKTNVVVVQHSDWNEDHTTDADLAYVKLMCAYQTINDGNGTSTARDPSAPATPSYRSTNTSFLPAALTSQNKKAKAYWQEADWRIMDEGYLPDHSSITTGGVDFSDAVETHWIFGSPADCNTIQKFWDKFVTNVPVPNNEPDYPTGRDYGGGEEPSGGASGAWIESGGIVVIEPEHGELHEDWTVRPSDYLLDPTMAGSMGSGWIEWAGAEKFATTLDDALANGVSVLKFEIKTAGDYTFKWRSKQYNAGQAGDAGNDSYVKFETGTVLPMVGSKGNTYTMTKLTKAWIQSKAAWAWGTNFEPVHGEFVYSPKVHYEAGMHEIKIAGRSKGHAIDRLILYRDGVNSATAQAAPESERSVQSVSFVYQATNDFPVINSGVVPYYKDLGNNALAVNAANTNYRDKFARAELTFAEAAGTYEVTITALKELDGECIYQLLVNGAVVGTAQNDPTTTDYEPQDHTFSGVVIPAGATIAVESKTHSNGKIPEGDAFAWARGRWRTLTLTSDGGGNGISVHAGEDQTLMLPASQVDLTGSASDDGAIDSVEWTQVSGPSTAVLTGSSQTNVTVSGMMAGTYVFSLTATDDQSNTASDEVEVTVTGQLVASSDDFSSAAYASSLNGVNWNPKWQGSTDQQNLLSGNGSVAVLDTTVAGENHHAPNKHGFSLVEDGQYAVVGSDFRYTHMAGGMATNGFDKGVFGLLFTPDSNWWTGPNNMFTLSNHGMGLGVQGMPASDIVSHAVLGVDTTAGGMSEWLRMEWTVERGASTYVATPSVLAADGSVLYTGPQMDLGYTNGVTIYGGLSTGGDGGNAHGTNIASYARIAEVNMDNFEILIFAPNYAPVFHADPIDGGSIEQTQAYTGTLAEAAFDPNADVLTFSKVSGPAWLQVASSGVLSGTPGAENVGANAFEVQAEDPDGEMTSAALNIQVLDAPPPLSETTVWNEDFEGTDLGATSGNNQTLSGSVVQTANTLSCKVVSAPAEFTLASGKVALLSTADNKYSAIRPSVNSIDLSSYDLRDGDTFTLSFDIYIPVALDYAIGSVNFRWKDAANTGNGPTDTAHQTLSAGQHHIEYTGTFPVDAGGFIPSNVRPFIWFAQNGVAVSEYVYFDNLNFVVEGAKTPGSEMPAYTVWAVGQGLEGWQANPTLDLDGDGFTNMEEYLAGFDPRSASSLFEIESIQQAIPDSTDLVITWDAQPGRIYNVSAATNLLTGPFEIIENDIHYPRNSATVDVSQVESGYLRVDVRVY